MDITERRISKIARGASHFVSRMLRLEGVGPSEVEFIMVVRRHPGITQAKICQKLDLDKGAAARLSARLEAKGYLHREPDQADKRRQLLFATEKTDEVKNSKSHLEELFYQWLLEPLSEGDRHELVRLLEILDQRCLSERREHYPTVTQMAQELSAVGPAEGSNPQR